MIKNKKEIISYLQGYWDDDLFEIKKQKAKTYRSKSQNRYYFGVVIKYISNYHGYSPIETHELLKQTFELKTTTDLSTVEFKYMIDIIRDYWNTYYDLYIPKPNELEEFKSLLSYLPNF